MFCFSFPKAIFASAIRLLTSVVVLGTFDARKMKSWTVSTFLLSITTGWGLGVMALHFVALIFTPYFKQTSCSWFQCFLHFGQKRENLTTFLKWVTIIRYIWNRVRLGQNLSKEGLKIPFHFVPLFYRPYKSIYRFLKLGALND